MKWKTEPCSAQQIMTVWKTGRVNTCTGELVPGCPGTLSFRVKAVGSGAVGAGRWLMADG